MVFSRTRITMKIRLVSIYQNNQLSHTLCSQKDLLICNHQTEGIKASYFGIRKALTLSLARMSIPDLINSSATAGEVIVAAQCNDPALSYNA